MERSVNNCVCDSLASIVLIISRDNFKGCNIPDGFLFNTWNHLKFIWKWNNEMIFDRFHHLIFHQTFAQECLWCWKPPRLLLQAPRRPLRFPHERFPWDGLSFGRRSSKFFLCIRINLLKFTILPSSSSRRILCFPRKLFASFSEMVGIAEAERAKIVRKPGILISVFWWIFLQSRARTRKQTSQLTGISWFQNTYLYKSQNRKSIFKKSAIKGQ